MKKRLYNQCLCAFYQFLNKELKLLVFFALFISYNSYGQELMNYYIEPNTTNNAVDLNTVVYRNMFSSFDGYSINTIDNIVTVTLCYYNTGGLSETTDFQNIEIILPIGYNDYSLNLEVYGDNDAVPPCSLDNLVDTGSIDFDFPYIPTDKTTIPDDYFENHLESLGFGDDLSSNDLVFTHRIINIKHLFLPNGSVASLAGINEFTILKDLRLGNNLVTGLDLSSNILLERLFCHQNPINQLDVSNNTLLRDLLCSFTNITNLNLTNNVNIESLNIGDNNISAIDLGQSINLHHLDFSGCQISTIDLSNNILLEFLNCSSNLLSSLNVSNNSNLRELYCYSNQIATLNLSNNSQLENVLVFANNLNFLNLKNGNCANTTVMNATNNDNPFCIEVDDEDEAPYPNWHIDPWAVYSEDCPPIGLNEEDLVEDIKIYPNPARDEIMINYHDQISTISIRDVLGNKMVFEKDLSSISEGFIELNVSRFTSGVYFITVGNKIKKFVKK